MSSTRRSAFIQTRVTPEERKDVERHAEAEGLSVSDYVRARLKLSRARSRRLEGLDAEALRELQRIGNNVNQVARSTNSGQQIQGQAAAVLADLQSVLRSLVTPPSST